jgi:hypothetical protein
MEYQAMEFTSFSADRTIGFPRAASSLDAYWKDVWNHTTKTMYVTNAGSGSVTLTTGQHGHLWFHDDTVEKWW